VSVDCGIGNKSHSFLALAGCMTSRRRATGRGRPSGWLFCCPSDGQAETPALGTQGACPATPPVESHLQLRAPCRAARHCAPCRAARHCAMQVITGLRKRLPSQGLCAQHDAGCAVPRMVDWTRLDIGFHARTVEGAQSAGASGASHPSIHLHLQ